LKFLFIMCDIIIYNILLINKQNLILMMKKNDIIHVIEKVYKET